MASSDAQDPRLTTEPWPPRTAPAERVAKRVIVLPGGSYPIDAPLLFWTAAGLVDDDWFVQAVRWQRPPMDAAFVHEALDLALREAPAADRTLVVAKSLGTLAAPVAAEVGIPAVWLTPVLSDPAVGQALSAYPAPQLVVGGSADSLWPQDAPQPSGEVMYVDGADHGMHRGGVRESNGIHMDIVERVRAFAAALVQ
ncbi:hypothetical protein GCM10011492_08890 [Flexivirga endophytica]|uniref:Alpha/beta hydrolase n=1 Tax=Flexivirga endophytica TaxID=1849103 RepID=A0A916SXB1_9MICO|nr:alpha/beta hydrolase [Flexivirga endophytica]GGB21188.1 hypothetical protein GCM10011492_08890 [Flexivirga endophytica]GHB58888.1 hypothetical protein GCM10008112_29910 [Flexivirga endophytica]